MKSTFKKNILSLSIGAGLVIMFSQSAMARPPQGEGHSGGRGHGQPDATAILGRMDFDGNGEVTVDDFVSRSLGHVDRHFARLDKDDDGLISVDEFSSRRSHRVPDESIDQDALKLCVEESTGLSLKERLEPAELFGEIDADGDGSLTIDEFTAHKTAHATERFSELDADEDGVISEAEITAHMAERKTLHEARKSCIEEQSLMDI